MLCIQSGSKQSCSFYLPKEVLYYLHTSINYLVAELELRGQVYACCLLFKSKWVSKFCLPLLLPKFKCYFCFSDGEYLR